MRIVLALVRKEFLQILRDPSALLIAACLPLLLLFIFGYGINLDASTLKVGLAYEAPGAYSLSLADSFVGSNFFIVSGRRTSREIRDSLLTGDLRGVVVIPASFQKSLESGQNADLMVMTDGTEPNSAIFVSNYAAGALRKWLEISAASQGRNEARSLIAIDGRFRYNQELKSRNFLVPGSLAVVLTLVGVILTSLVISREWERGTMEALMATPVTIWQMLFSKLIAYYLLALLSSLLSWAAAVYWYQVPFRGSVLALLALSTVYLLGALGQGLLISTLARNQFVSAQYAIITGFLPSFMFSGFVFEISSIPSPVRELTYAVSARYLVPCLQTIFLAGDIWPLFLRSMAVMLAIGLGFFLLAALKTDKRVF
jgi:ABC-2 type transport system permease protein